MLVFDVIVRLPVYGFLINYPLWNEGDTFFWRWAFLQLLMRTEFYFHSFWKSESYLLVIAIAKFFAKQVLQEEEKRLCSRIYCRNAKHWPKLKQAWIKVVVFLRLHIPFMRAGLKESQIVKQTIALSFLRSAEEESQIVGLVHLQHTKGKFCIQPDLNPTGFSGYKYK